MDNFKGAIKKTYPQTFRNSWLADDLFKGWLAPHPTENLAICNLCNITIRCCKSDLIRHSQRAKHIKNCESNSQSQSQSQNLKNNFHIDNVKRAKIKLTAFYAEHNIALYTADHLVPLLKDICIDSSIVQDLSLARSKCTNIIKEVLAKREIEKILNILQNEKFSILIDESTDIGDTKILCVLVQYFSSFHKKIKTQLLELLELNATDCSANSIFHLFKKLLEKYKIPITNIVGMASDNAYVMIGCNNSFFSRLQSEIPGIVMLNCICHSSALVASKACEKLPQSCENLIRAVATYISGSAKRCTILKEFQDFFDIEKNKILKLATTRWLVLHKCVVRLLKNWEALKHFFTLAVHEDKLKSAELILTDLNNNNIKSYLLFLKYSLNFFNTFNALFQGRQILIHVLFEESQKIIRQIAQNFIKPKALENIISLDVDNENYIQDLNDIYVGPECESFLATQSLECAQEIRLKCLDFYKTAVREMLKRLPYKDIFFQQLTFLNPSITLFDEGRIKIRDLTCVANRVENIDINKLAFEWRILPSAFNEIEKQKLMSLEIDEMWATIFEHKDFNGEKVFPNLKLLVQAVLSFPHSNAEAERIFSIVSDVKNKKRNRLSVDTLSAISIVRSSFQAEGINCINFEVDSRHLELHNSQNLYTKSDYSLSDGK